MSNIVKFILFFTVCLSVCVASKLKCAKVCNKACPNTMSPCPLGVLCPRGTILKRSKGGCCCEADDRPEGPKPPRPRTCPGKHEVFDKCGPGCGDPRCGTKRICPMVCVEGCYCKRGYARDSNNACIPIELCDAEQRCRNKNETYNLCGSACAERTCDISGAEMSCPDVCVPGCYCNGGYVRNQGVCILSDDCPGNARCRGINEVYKVDCLDHNCPPGLMCPAVCREICICRDGFERNDQGTCVPIKNCKSTCTGKFESCTECGSGCGDLNCGDDPNRMCPAVCRSGCYCDPGYARNEHGNCIPISECPAKCGANQIYDECGSACGDFTCDNYGQPRGCTKNCVAGCYCAKDYVMFKGECIPFNECPAKCGANQIYNECGSACGDFTCDNYGQPRKCTRNCVAGCYCAKDHVMFKGECIPFNKCPAKCSGAFESYTDCGSGCGDFNCGDDPNRLCPEYCREGCYCNRGYARNKNGKCIPINECPATCGTNQIFDDCGSACGNFTCDSYGKPRICTMNCVADCYCAEGYVTFEGECIPFNKCPVGCKLHEEYSECGSNGCQNTCENPTLGHVCRAICQSGCICVEGYLRDASGQCVRKDLC